MLEPVHRWRGGIISPNPRAPDFAACVNASMPAGVDGSALQNHVNRSGAAAWTAWTWLLAAARVSRFAFVMPAHRDA